jgi:hypothetical protein
MPRVEPEMLGDQELALVFMATTLVEARCAETILTQRGVNYVVRPEPCGHTLFGSPRVGAAFYVQVNQAEYCASQFEAAGLGLGVVIDEAPES